MRRRSLVACLAALLMAGAAAPVLAHGYKLGEFYLAHPHGHAITLSTGELALSLHFAAVRNGEAHTERLLSARSAGRPVSLQRRTADGSYADVDAIVFVAGERLALRTGAEFRLLLRGLDKPAKTGERLPLNLSFERAGAIDVEVAVEQPKEATHAKP